MRDVLVVNSPEFKPFSVASLALAAVKNLELIAGIGGKEAGYVTQALGKGRRREQGVLPLAEVVVVEVDGQRKHVHGKRIGEGGLVVAIAGALIDGFLAAGAAVQGAAAGLPGVLAGLAPDLGFGLRPGE